ncbi:MAG: hypothetical protein ACR2NB_12495, partial [Solirubrobacteraceae bacterium]
MGRISGAFGGWPILVACLLAAAGCGVAIPLVDGAAGSVPGYWLLLIGLAAAAAGAAIWAACHRQVAAPLGLVALTVLGYFVIRPLNLALAADRLASSSYDYFHSPLQSVLDLRSQEIELYANTKLLGAFDAALTRAVAAVALFFLAFLIGFGLRVGRRAATRLGRVGRSTEGADLRWVAPVWLVLGLLGQLAVIAVIGGPGAASRQLGTQANLAVSFSLLVLLNFSTVGLVLWTCFHPPR